MKILNAFRRINVIDHQSRLAVIVELCRFRIMESAPRHGMLVDAGQDSDDTMVIYPRHYMNPFATAGSNCYLFSCGTTGLAHSAVDYFLSLRQNTCSILYSFSVRIGR
jgi:hypothetical protein